MSNRRVLAFDFGASSGRAMLGEFDGQTIRMQEIHRFANEPVTVGKTIYWDILRLYHETRQGIAKAVRAGGFDAIGIDTWGVDFALLDKRGNMLGNPVHYRDLRTEGIDGQVFELIPKEILYGATGIQHMRINTVFQLAYLAKYRPEIMENAETLLQIPDLLAYFLTGKKRSEITNSSTTGLFNPETKNWCFDVCEMLGIKKSLFAKTIYPGEIYGILSKELCQELSCEEVPVIAVPTHDTASAVVSAPAVSRDFVYISCGTWSLLGIESDKPIICKESMEANFTNEIGFNDKIRFLKNIMGLWLIQESRRQWQREGFDVDFNTLENEALEAEPFLCYIDPDAPDFETPGNLPERIKDYCGRTGQYVPKTRGEIMRCIYQSLALKYRYTVENLEKLTGKHFKTINIIGGGIKDALLCRMTANASGRDVHAGPVEATVMGNIAVQFIALGEIKDLSGARKIIRNSTDIKVFKPVQQEEWQRAYEDYIKIL
ncbi:rhamnulokinase [Ruminiclostridium cellobioparum]|uniref:Carbohydrate kinase n=1 Tax=Ruminiclostridium cellobioparum subsp. termitidis CT1112 TaxID=1195236 RepID=S0FWM8_RUMCE|nr:rhamnulokinase family protein [Ruminiclostridium cellobioparum]EMS72948.1 carbohydrate kinase [Ruminiclostridium cellobioparum subsp. termitidis CT1112]